MRESDRTVSRRRFLQRIGLLSTSAAVVATVPELVMDVLDALAPRRLLVPGAQFGAQLDAWKEVSFRMDDAMLKASLSGTAYDNAIQDVAGRYAAHIDQIILDRLSGSVFPSIDALDAAVSAPVPLYDDHIRPALFALRKSVEPGTDTRVRLRSFYEPYGGVVAIDTLGAEPGAPKLLLPADFTPTITIGHGGIVPLRKGQNNT